MSIISKIANGVAMLIKVGQNTENIKMMIYNQQIVQRQLFLHYQMLINNKQSLPGFRNAGFRVYSQSDEDGILLYIFSLIGFTNKILVDIAFGIPFGANTTNLICNWGFSGLLVEGNKKEMEVSNKYFISHPDTFILPPKARCYWVTAENINEIIKENNISGEIDLFSLDVDGVDYWFWKNLTIIKPRVVVIEAATFLGNQKSLTVPYNPKFACSNMHPNYYGASIPAFVKLAREKGYRLVACNRFGYNLFFVRSDLGMNVLPEIPVDECFNFEPPDLKAGREERLKSVINYEWVVV